jgi:hypothetical protein
MLVAAAAFPVSDVTVLPGVSRILVRFAFLSRTMLDVIDRALAVSGLLGNECVMFWPKLDAWKELGAIEDAKEAVD